MHQLSDTVNRKFIETFSVDEWEIETDSGWVDITSVSKTIPYKRWVLKLENGYELLCADTHIVFTGALEEIFVKDLSVNDLVMTDSGAFKVFKIYETDIIENMYDLSVNSGDHRFFSNGILSHNSTTVCGFMLWYLIFNSDKTVALLANKGDTAQEILSRVQLAYENLPIWLQQGIATWNKRRIELENNSRIIAAATSSSAIRGYTINFLFIDEMAHIEDWESFYTSVYPTIANSKQSKIALVSTPLGLNHFWAFWEGARMKKNNYNPILVTWTQVPGRDEKWKQEILGGMNNDLEKFSQEFEVEFQGSSGTLIAGWKLKQLVPQVPIHEKDGLYQYIPSEKDHSYVCVVDISRGKGLDYSAFHIIDVTNVPYNQVCVFRSNMITPLDYCEVIHRVGKTYNNAYILIEINDSYGSQISMALYYDFEYENIFFTEGAGRNGKKISAGFAKNTEMGIITTKPVKQAGCSFAKLLIEQNQLILNDANTIGELSTFSKKAESYKAEPGKHDDLAMGLVLFGWLSHQQYFKELTDIHTMQHLRDKTSAEIDMDMAPFGYIDDGGTVDEVIEPKFRSWLIGSDEDLIPDKEFSIMTNF